MNWIVCAYLFGPCFVAQPIVNVLPVEEIAYVCDQSGCYDRGYGDAGGMYRGPGYYPGRRYRGRDYDGGYGDNYDDRLNRDYDRPYVPRSRHCAYVAGVRVCN